MVRVTKQARLTDLLRTVDRSERRTVALFKVGKPLKETRYCPPEVWADVQIIEHLVYSVEVDLNIAPRAVLMQAPADSHRYSRPSLLSC